MIKIKGILKTIGEEETIMDTIKKWKLGLFGQICEMNDNRLIKHAIFVKIDEKFRRGHPYREWQNYIKD